MAAHPGWSRLGPSYPSHRAVLTLSLFLWILSHDVFRRVCVSDVSRDVTKDQTSTSLGGASAVDEQSTFGPTTRHDHARDRPLAASPFLGGLPCLLRLASNSTFRPGSLLAARQNGFVIYGGLSRDGFPCSAAAAGLAQAVRVLLAVDVSQLFSPSLSSPPSFSFGVACVMGAVWPMCGRLAVGRRGEVSSPGVGEG